MYEADISLLKPGEYLYNRGNTSEEFYLILYGRMIFTDNRSQDNYVVEIGQCIGEELVVGKSIRNYESCYADIDTALIHVTYVRWKEL